MIKETHIVHGGRYGDDVPIAPFDTTVPYTRDQ